MSATRAERALRKATIISASGTLVGIVVLGVVLLVRGLT